MLARHLDNEDCTKLTYQKVPKFEVFEAAMIKTQLRSGLVEPVQKTGPLVRAGLCSIQDLQGELRNLDLTGETTGLGGYKDRNGCDVSYAYRRLAAGKNSKVPLRELTFFLRLPSDQRLWFSTSQWPTSAFPTAVEQLPKDLVRYFE